jgi:hypothetical protein
MKVLSNFMSTILRAQICMATDLSMISSRYPLCLSATMCSSSTTRHVSWSSLSMCTQGRPMISNKVARLMHVVRVEAQTQSTYLPSSIILLIRAFAFSMVQTAM